MSKHEALLRIHFSYELIILTLSTLKLYDVSAAHHNTADLSPTIIVQTEEGGYPLPLVIVVVLVSLFHRIMCSVVAPSVCRNRIEIRGCRRKSVESSDYTSCTK